MENATEVPERAPVVEGDVTWVVETRRDSVRPSVARRTPSSNDDFFRREQLEELRAYQRPLRRAKRIRLVVGTAVELIVIFWLQIPARMADGVTGGWGWALQLMAIAVVLSVVEAVVKAPFSWWANLVYEKRAGYSTTTPATWTKDQFVSLIMDLVLTAVLVLPLYAAVRAVELWWLVGTIVVIAVQLLFAFVYPVLIMPRFNKFTPLPDGPIRTRIEEIAKLAGVPIQGAYLMDASKRTTRPNAGVTGFGATKRVIVNDTICDFPLDELSQVIAHELGHYRLQHILKSFPLAAMQIPLVLLAVEFVAGNPTLLRLAGAEGLGDPASYGLFGLVFGLGFTLPRAPLMWLSRKHEREADLEALELLGDPTSLINMWPRMVLDNKGVLEPTWWERATSSHPEIAERIQFGIDWARLNDVPVVPPEPRYVERATT